MNQSCLESIFIHYRQAYQTFRFSVVRLSHHNQSNMVLINSWQVFHALLWGWPPWLLFWLSLSLGFDHDFSAAISGNVPVLRL